MKKIVSVFLAVLMLSTSVCAATIDETAPYAGDYAVVYNTVSTDPDMPYSSSYLSTDQTAAEGYDMVVPALLPDNFNELKESYNNSVLPALASSAAETVGGTYTFYDGLITGAGYSSFSAKYMYSGSYCDIYVKTTLAEDRDLCAAIAEEFDKNIRNRMVQTFGSYLSGRINIFSGEPDVNGKVAIILEDSVNLPGLLGLYSGADLLPVIVGGNGNNRSILHINGQLLSGSDIEEYGATIAHEMQHLIDATYYIRDILGGKTREYTEMWLNEGLSEAAVGLIYDNSDRILYYNMDYDGSIKNGAILCYTDYAQNDNSVVANYSLPYLFLQYIRAQTKELSGGGSDIFKKIKISGLPGSAAIEEVLKEIGYPVTEFSQLNRNFRIAMTLKEPDGYYGFKGESEFNDIYQPITLVMPKDLDFSAAVVVRVNNQVNPIFSDPNIKVAAFSRLVDYTVKGDINGDGSLDDNDVLIFRRYLAKWNVIVIESAIDFNGDGGVDDNDVNLLARYLAKWDVSIN